VRGLTAVAMLAMLSACGQDEAPVQVQRFELDDARHVAEAPQGSPDTADATWTVGKNGQTINFGKTGAAPLMTLACNLKAEPAQLVVIRHASTRPGLKAMFPILAGGKVSRFPVDATLVDNEWRWQGSLPASDPLNDVFSTAAEIEATLPGAGSLLIGPSRIPGEFVDWCRAGGRLQRAQAPEATPTPTDSPKPTPSAKPTAKPSPATSPKPKTKPAR